nr:TnsD family Tn7-like transposition protein [Psychrobacillus sp. BL-248-WT-3]
MKLISEQTVYLFYKKDSTRDTNTAYISYLYESGYLKDFALDEKSLTNDFMLFYSDSICKIINIDKKYVISTLIRRIKEAATGDIHPLFHILFLIFCGKKIKHLNENNQLTIPFDSDLFIEKTCKCFDGFFIHNSTLRFRKEGLIGSVKCSCGNYYGIESWNMKIEVRYGEKFTEQVGELLFVEDLPISEISSKLNISKSDLKNYLISRRNSARY